MVFRERRGLSKMGSLVLAIIIIIGVAAGGLYALSVGTLAPTNATTTTTGLAGYQNVTFGFAGPPDVTDTPGFMLWQNFAHHVGLNLNVQYFEGDSTVAEALVSGSVQVAEGGFQSTLLADQSEGNASGSYPFLIFSNYEAVNDYALVVPNSITNYSQLAGKAIATSGPGSSSNLFCNLLLSEHGLTGSQINCAPIGGGGSRYRALIAGQVVGDIAEPYQVVSAVATGHYHILASIPQQFPQIMFSVLYTSRAYATAHSDVITKITEATLLADRWAQNETAWVAKEQEEFPGTNVTIAATAWKIWVAMGLWQPNGGLTVSNVDASVNFLLNGRAISSYLNPKYFVDVSYLQSALADQGTYTAGPIYDSSIPTINVVIPGFGTSGPTSSGLTSGMMIATIAGPVLLSGGARRSRRKN
ncbi:MAG: ABC transporter substrate-binding protein [Thaumarchaeota archaeon]|nr:ABC transporter substrate-binding protein [Nitrososphaerota archaeon]